MAIDPNKPVDFSTAQVGKALTDDQQAMWQEGLGHDLSELTGDDGNVTQEGLEILNETGGDDKQIMANDDDKKAADKALDSHAAQNILKGKKEEELDKKSRES